MKGAKLAAGVILGLFLLTALLGPLVAQHAPFAVDGEPFARPSAAHWLGTNSLGQDVFSGLVHGARTSLLVGLSVALLSTALSGLFGLLAGYSKKCDLLLNSLANMLLVLPSLLLILIVASFTGGGTGQLILTLGLLTWPGYMRLIRASVLSLKEREFVKAAQMFQGGTCYILRKHLLPFLWPLLKTKFIMSFRQAIAIESSLSFLGIGDPNVPSWGTMLQQAFQRNETWLTDVWQWTVLPPVLAILLVMIGLALLGEGDASKRKPARAARRKERANRQEPSVRLQTGGPAAASDDKQPAIAAEGLSVAYGSQVILHPVSFTVEAGSITALIGESGAGKTTLARALYGLQPEGAVRGSVLLAGKRVYGGSANDRLKRWIDAAFIFQDPRTSFNPLMTIGRQFAETMNHPGTIRDKRQEAARALREVQLDEWVLDRYPHELSGGMLSRALIALALINRPRVLIADEPTSALDPILKREILELLAAKVRELGMTMLLITHDVRAARHVADRMLLLAGGQLIEQCAKEEEIG
ncbi:ATP-binding cassette domain-containing protein [Brevibacillus marinus]|uniref:ATP-binding cassette domain-containing protein n=1 Tax=Brevibacillus marinus TaxID=2496837 RepID=UPI000F84126A|nr:ATP-binding cassette domain-containing protein [Brevibacillus marinus]